MHNFFRAGLAGLLILGVVWLAPVRPVKAAPAATVTADAVVGGSCTESDLINALAAGGLVTFACGGPKSIPISTVKVISKDTTLDGGDAITLSGGFGTRLFVVNPGVNFQLKHIILDEAASTGGDGGAIANHGALTLDHATIQHSQTDSGHSGGAIFSDGPVTLTSSLLISNTGGSAGALFANFGNAVVHISNSTLDGNHAVNTTTGNGGAIWVGQGAQVSISGGSVTSNTAQFGGGVYITQGGAFTVTASGPPALINGNTASLAGGGIYNSVASASLTNADLEDNSALNADSHVTTFGGGLFVISGTVILTDTLVQTNTATDGGGLASDTAGQISLLRSSVSGNKAFNGAGLYLTHGSNLRMLGGAITGNVAKYGGGIENKNASLAAVTGTVVSGNAAQFSGAGIDSVFAAVSVSASTLSGNHSDDTGGAVAALESTLTVTNATLSDNLAKTGGGLYSDNAAAALTNVTLAGNAALQQGGSIYAISGTVALRAPDTTLKARVTLTNTLLAAGGVSGNCAGDDFTSGGYNLSSDNTCAAFLTQTGDLNNTAPHLGPLANNGGPTPTRLPEAGSPAIDAIPLNTNGCGSLILSDQRGAPRPIPNGGQCDMGAVEAGWIHAVLWLTLLLR